MNVSIVGTGYVGLVSGTCFADLGVNVTCVDRDSQKINRLVYGAIPIYEPGLDNMINRNVNDKRLTFLSDYKQGFINQDFVFCAIDTTADEDGSTAGCLPGVHFQREKEDRPHPSPGAYRPGTEGERLSR